MQPIWHPSPNFGPRRDGLKPTLIVVHYTAMKSAEAALERLCDPVYEVSAHYLIGSQGQVWQMVDEEMRAWHAGAGRWGGCEDINSRSIGIELDNRGDHPFAEPQMVVLEKMLDGILRRWGIAAEGVIGHSDMAPIRKQDPGLHFDWQRLARQGLAGSGERTAPRVADLETAFRSLSIAQGYNAELPTSDILTAVRLRFAPWRQGPLCEDDLRMTHLAR